jgi:hypothetical protein
MVKTTGLTRQTRQFLKCTLTFRRCQRKLNAQTKGKLVEGLGSMLCAPISYSLRGDSLIRANNAINGMTLKQLRTGIL